MELDSTSICCDGLSFTAFEMGSARAFWAFSSLLCVAQLAMRWDGSNGMEMRCM